MEDKILNRIKKMMALANDAAATEQERDTALKMAYNLLAKHNLSMIDVENHLPQEKREKLDAIFVSTVWARHIARIISDLFFCKYILGHKTNAWKGHHYFVGKESNATTAMLMSEYIITSILKEVRKLYKDDSCPNARSFAVGACDKLRQRVNQLIKDQENKTPGTALMLQNLYDSEDDANNAFLIQIGFMTELIKHRGKNSVNSAAYSAGKQYGESIGLSPQVSSGKDRSQLLLK